MWSFLERLMPDKASNQPDKTDADSAPGKLREAFSQFETEILDAVEQKADSGVRSAAATLESEISETEQKVETAVDDTIDRIDPKRRGEPRAEDPTAAEPANTTVPPPRSTMRDYRDLAFGAGEPAPGSPGGAGDGTAGNAPSADAPNTSALNSATVQSVGFQNQEVQSYAPTMVVTPPDQMIGQAAGLAAQASAQYFDSMTKIIMASQSVMLKKMAENVAAGNLVTAAEDGLVIAETELLLAAAMAVAAAGGAMEAESASFGISKINESVQARTGKSGGN